MNQENEQGYYLSSKELALPNCPRCHGTGNIDQVQENGMHKYFICACVIARQNMLAADMRIQRIMPGRLGRMTFKTYDTGNDAKNELALRVAKNFVEHWPIAQAEGWILGFYGEMTAGKTHLAAAIAISCVKRYLIHPYVLSVPRMLEMQRESFDQKGGDVPRPVRMAIEADLLVLDDIGAEYVRKGDEGRVSWVEDMLFQIVDERVNADRPIVYTTNYTTTQMRKMVAPRVYQRLLRNQVTDPLEVLRVKNRGKANAHRLDLLLGNDGENNE